MKPMVLFVASTTFLWQCGQENKGKSLQCTQLDPTVPKYSNPEEFSWFYYLKELITDGAVNIYFSSTLSLTCENVELTI